MKEFYVHYTDAAEGYCYTGQWDTEIVEAESAEEAVELVKDYILESLTQGGYYDDLRNNGIDIDAIEDINSRYVFKAEERVDC